MMTRDQLIDRLLTKIPDDELDTTMRWIDEYVATVIDQPVERWTAAEVAVYIGASGTAAARSTLSRWGIGSVGEPCKHPISGRSLAMYPAEKVREMHAKNLVEEFE